jgi:DNA-binding transcriptional ArsR family regulator
MSTSVRTSQDGTTGERSGFTQVSNRALFDERLTLADQAIDSKLQHLLGLHRPDRANTNVIGLPVTLPPQRVLAGLLGLAIPTLHRHLGRLRECGYLDWERRSRRAPLAYRLFDEPQVDEQQRTAYPPWPDEPECSTRVTTECSAGGATARASLPSEYEQPEDDVVVPDHNETIELVEHANDPLFEELLTDVGGDPTPRQRSEWHRAFRESPGGFERCVADALHGDTPVALLASLVARRSHLRPASSRRGLTAREVLDLDLADLSADLRASA